MNISLPSFVPTLLDAFATIRHPAAAALVRQPDPNATIALRKKSIFKIPHPLGRRIVCESGAIWITVDDDRRDFVLQTGDSFSATSDRLVMIQALEPAAIRVA